ncbi:hypothetical protein BAMY_13160 [Bacillus amyloliquefaciens]|uniref:Type I restriction modification DNA specificity domain-containing protein n=1 Tax=Bacillus velezensis TaxID=492670 RepID=A0A6A8LMN7_BACVE|nr:MULTISPECIES: restriction endonuclease subunit S [Bacillus]APB83094.1 hypothetical protein BAMY_13160 [Bacillus amyloliquefaciens]AVX16529.1 hypothetical protein C5I45_06450 [Bacillus sp. ZY-1-1]AWM83932.1 hypothetical protein B7L90_12330 [Bacillus velezensis]MCC8302702.1 restriction endonuclease subunit S [Bacillus sp. AF12]MDF3254573.1 restriction endonuclease subunit S [Bacillus velezensis]
MSKNKKTIEELLEEAVVPKEEQTYEVPENWVYFKFTSIFDVQGGTQPPKSQFVDEEREGYVRLVQIRDFSSDKYKTYIPNTQKLRKMKEEDILIARYGASIGRILTGLSGAYNVALAKVVYPKGKVDKKFLFWLLKSEHFQIPLMGISRSAQSGFNKNDLSYFKMPLPPLNEQKRIAEKVERLLSKIEEAKQLIEEAKETFELRRAAILDKAFRGELTRKWREENSSIESALERIELIKQERFYIAETKKEISEITEMFDELNTEECIDNNEWLYLKANMFCYNINCGGTPSKDISEEGEIPFLKVYNIVNNKVSFSYKPQYIPKEVHKSKLKKSILKANDVIMNIVGPPLKKIAIIPEEYYEMNMNQAIVRFRPIKYVLPKYLYYCLQYDETLRDVINETRGVVGQSNISVSQSRNLIMPIPPLEEQAEIVNKLEEMIKREEIALSLVSDEKNLDELKQSILSKAFRGELGTNDPTEENAIELLKEVLQEQVK